tara:strand:+ start:145 stop:495 length:351 start_codon:yes stop_codon:yes gene_type:complete
MKYDKWKLEINDSDFFYYRRREDGYVIKVYPMLSFNILKGPTGIIYWICDHKDLNIKNRDELEVMFFMDILLSKDGASLSAPFSPEIISSEGLVKKLQDSYLEKRKLNSLCKFSCK